MYITENADDHVVYHPHFCALILLFTHSHTELEKSENRINE